MKTWTHYIAPALALTLALPVGRAADDEKPQPKDKKSPLRVLAAPDREPRVWVQRGDKMEKETVTFLGVEASPAPAALAAQLGLARGTGLVVGNVAPKSAAEGVLQQHDILLKLDDQILIEPHQLSVLIRNHKEGDEVTLTYIRAGKQATAKVKLTTHEITKVSVIDTNMPRAFGYATGTTGDGRLEMHVKRPEGLEGEEWNRVLSLLQRSRGAPDGPPGSIPPGARIRIDHGNGPGFRAMSVNTGNSNLAYSDDQGSLDLTMKDGTKMLVAKNAKGEQLFSGPVSTPEERKALPQNVRERLEKLEGMHDITFRTDGDFKGAEMRVMPFPPKEISMPTAPRTPQPGRPAPFF
jgi:serine protease Do